MQNGNPQESGPNAPDPVIPPQSVSPPPPIHGAGQAPVTISPTEINLQSPLTETNNTAIKNPSGIVVSGIYTSPTPTSNDVSTVTPVATYNNQEHITGSMLAEEKVKMPIGVYIVAAWTFLGFVTSFLNTSQNSEIFSIVMLLDLFLAIGLLLRLEIARKAMVWISGALIVLAVVSVVILAALQAKIKDDRIRFNNAVSQLNQQNLTSQQQQFISNAKTQLDKEQKKAGKVVAIAYLDEASSLVASVIIIIYLTRPKIKDTFNSPT